MWIRVGIALTLIGGQSSAQSVPVVANQRPSWTTATQWKLSAKPILDIGTADGAPEHEFGLISGVLRLDDGGLAVADMQANQIRFFDKTGQFRKAVGRRGSGPGEWTQLARLSRFRGDTILGAGFSGPYELFSQGGDYVRRLQLENRTRLTIVGFRSDGSLVAYNSGINESPGRTGEWTDSTEYFEYSADGVRTRSYGHKPFLRMTAIDGGSSGPTFGATSTSAVIGELFYHNFTDDFAIDVYDRSGKLVRRIQRAWTPARVTNEDIDKHRRAYVYALNDVGSPSDPETHRQRQRRFEQLKFSRSFPAHGRMIADRVGNLWVQEYRRPTDQPLPARFFELADLPIKWDVFNSQGRWLGQVTTPGKFFVMDIGADYIAGTSRDDLDVPHARVYGLQKPLCRPPECR
ncbi:MAG: 6-bladed beta-propeller [Gemmatimonadota bacterium]